MNSLETPQRRWPSSRLEGRTSWIFSSCGRSSRITTGTKGTRTCGLRKGQSPCELLRGLSGFLSRRCLGLRSCVESVLEREDSSPVLTWILGYFWSLSGQSVLYESGHERALSSRAVAACHASLCLDQGICGFPSSFPTRVSHETFPQGCPMGHRGVSRSSA